MPSVYVRDLPDDVHGVLVRRAARRGLSLNRYAIDVLAAHCALPTIDEWLDELDGLEAAPDVSGADAVRRAREADDAELARARRP